MKNWSKKFIHTFIIDEKGAVSVFLIMIVLLVFIFNAVLIDFARIIIAERQTEEAAKAALRSTMSAYHQSLQDSGLFAFDGDDAKASSIFHEVFVKNISPNDSGNFELLGLRAEEGDITVNVDFGKSLANREVLRYQILEEMKYKAPIEAGEALLQNFLTISEKVEEASDFAKVAVEVNELAEERTEKIEEALNLLEEAKEALENVKSEARFKKGGSYPEIETIYDIYMFHFSRYVADLKKIEELESADDDNDEIDEDSNEEELEKLKERTKEFKGRALGMLKGILEAAETAHEKVGQAKDLITEAEELNDEIIAKIDEGSDETDYENANNMAENNLEGSIDTSMLDDYKMDLSFFTDVLEHLNDAESFLKAPGQQTDGLIDKLEVDFIPKVEADFPDRRNKNKVRNDAEHTHNYHKKALQHIENAISLINEKMEEYFENTEGRSKDEVEEEIEEEEERADEGMEDSRDVMDDIKDAIDSGSLAAADLEKLRSLNEKANNYGATNSENNKEFSFDDRDETMDEAMSLVDTIFKGIGDALVGARDRVYVNEYILMRFNSHDFDKTGPEKYSFENNQVEYIIYGLEEYGMNYYAAMGEIFAVRFAINLTHALMKPNNKGFGPWFWVAALADAFVQTAVDMDDIRKGRAVELFPGLKLKNTPVMMSYKDHLRLFMFIHSENGKFNRLMAVLHDKADQDLHEASTYVSANATASIDLWFLPQVADFLGNTGVLDGFVEDGRYYIEKEVHFSY